MSDKLLNDALLTSIKEHLEFAGYTVDLSEDEKPRLRAKHALKSNLWIRRFRGGVLFSAFYLSSEAGKSKRDELLRLVNIMNEASGISHCYADKPGDLIIEGWYPGTYNRQDFAVFLDNFNEDVSMGLMPAVN